MRASCIDMKIGLSDDDKKRMEESVLAKTNGGPRKVFDTLQELRINLPLGAEGTYLVLEGDIRGPHYYFWKDNMWTDGGLYLGTGGLLSDKVDWKDVEPPKSTKVVGLNKYGMIDSQYLPGFVDDIIEGKFNKEKTVFTEDKPPHKVWQAGTPEIDTKVFIDTADNKSYRWSGTQFTVIGSDLTLGETSSTAYAGDKGAANRKDIDTLNKEITYNRVGLLKVTEYNTNTGYITLDWEDNVLKSLIYNPDSGVLTITY